MKKRIPLILVALLLFGCSIPSIGTQPTATVPLVPTNPSSPTNPPEATFTPVPTEPPEPVSNVICNKLNLFLDPAMASGFKCETIPESTIPIETYPEYTKITLQGYVLSGTFFEGQISLFPVQGYTTLQPDIFPGRVTDLQALIAGGAPGTSLPFLPTFNAAQTFHAQYQVVPFVGGSGIRYLTLYAQYAAPINNHDLFYTYQGLTSDGTYWVSAILPINNPILPATAATLPAGMTPDQFISAYDSYLPDITAQLNSQTSASFTPSLTALDALVASIVVEP